MEFHRFAGVRCAEHQSTPPKHGEHFVYTHEIGRGCLHVGRHRHGANELTGGERINLILWCRSSEFRDSSKRDEHDWWCEWRK